MLSEVEFTQVRDHQNMQVSQDARARKSFRCGKALVWSKLFNTLVRQCPIAQRFQPTESPYKNPFFALDKNGRHQRTESRVLREAQVSR